MEPEADPSTIPKPRRPLPVHTPEGRHRSGMLRRFGALYYLSGLGVLLRSLRLEDHSVENIRRAAAAGPLVYVLYSRSLLDWAALNRVLNQRRLPLAQFTNGPRSTWFKPVVDLASELWGSLRERLRQGPAPDPITSGWLSEAVREGLTSCIFLVHPPKVRAPLLDRFRKALGTAPPDPVAALLDAQSHSDTPIQVVPIVVIWQRSPEQLRSEVARAVLGSQDEPGPLQKVWAALVRSSHAVVQAGDPLDLQELTQRFDDDPRRRLRAARILLRRYLYRESHVIRGPRIRPQRWTRRVVLRSPEVRALIREEASTSGRSVESLRREVEHTFDRMAPRPSFPVVEFANHFCGFLFNRIFAGVDIRPEDVDKLRSALRAGTPVLVPSHRSHLDYLLISWILYQHDIVIPQVVAGENLSFWPAGPLLRRSGAIFIKRTFKGDRIFPVVFDRYLRQVIRDGHPVEFYIEGGRSRTGKLLPARLGVLGMVLDAANLGREDRTTTLLPIAISYEQIAEESSYAHELSGSGKKTEDIGQFVKAGRVFRKRFGKVYLRVGEPLPCPRIFAEQSAPWTALDREQRREALQRTGERLMFRIAQSMTILPTGLVSMALLAQSRHGVRLSELHERVNRLDTLLRQRGAHPTDSMSYGGWAVEEALTRFERDKMIRRLSDEEGDILQILDEKRITLEYYKNGLIHFVAPISLMAAAARACRDQAPLQTQELFRLFRFQVFLLRYEFTLDPEVGLHQLQDRALDALIAYGALARDADGQPIIASPMLVSELAEITRNFLESYSLVIRSSRILRSRDIPLNTLPDKVQEVGKGLLAVDEILRPEALSMANLKNAVRAYSDEGALHFTEGGGGLHFDEDAWKQYTQTFQRLLG